MRAGPEDADEEGAEGGEAGGYDGYGGIGGRPDGEGDVVPCVHSFSVFVGVLRKGLTYRLCRLFCRTLRA